MSYVYQRITYGVKLSCEPWEYSVFSYPLAAGRAGPGISGWTDRNAENCRLAIFQFSVTSILIRYDTYVGTNLNSSLTINSKLKWTLFSRTNNISSAETVKLRLSVTGLIWRNLSYNWSYFRLTLFAALRSLCVSKSTLIEIIACLRTSSFHDWTGTKLVS